MVVVVKTREGEEEGEEHEEARCRPPWAAGRMTTLPQWAHRMAMAYPGDLEAPWTMVSEQAGLAGWLACSLDLADCRGWQLHC